jgi:hypothetical protein
MIDVEIIEVPFIFRLFISCFILLSKKLSAAVLLEYYLLEGSSVAKRPEHRMIGCIEFVILF